jgi:hypothetical protein
MKMDAVSDLGYYITKNFLVYRRHRIFLKYGNEGGGVKQIPLSGL